MVLIGWEREWYYLVGRGNGINWLGEGMVLIGWEREWY